MRTLFISGVLTLLLTSGTITSAVGLTDLQVNKYIETLDKFELVLPEKLEAEGEKKIELSKDEPKVTLKKWNGEVALGISYNKIKAKGSRKILTNTVEWKSAKEELHVYPIDDENLEIEVILNEKPDTNQFDFIIDGAEQLNFFYQPALTAEEIAEGAQRPENVVGSLAVYYLKSNHKIGETNYTTGKAFHIYRPKVIDVNGAWVWGELDIKGNKLTVTVPQTFLDTAVYPVTIDPTFGYTTIGGTTSTRALDRIYLTKGTLTEAGDVTSVSKYIKVTVGTQNDKATIYNDSGGSPVNQSLRASSAAVSINTTAQWQTYNLTVSLTTTDYWLGGISDGTVTYYYDISGANSTFQDSVGSYTTPPDPHPSTASTNARKISIYATYTASGGITKCVLNPIHTSDTYIGTECYISSATTTQGIIYLIDSGKIHCINNSTIEAKGIIGKKGTLLTGTTGCKIELWKP